MYRAGPRGEKAQSSRLNVVIVRRRMSGISVSIHGGQVWYGSLRVTLRLSLWWASCWERSSPRAGAHIGARNAELLEIPVMLVAVYFAGRWVAFRSGSQRQALGIGFLALAMLLGAEVLLAAVLFRKLPLDALLNKDPISGAAYYFALLVFAIMPRWLFQKGTLRDEDSGS